MRSSLLLKRRLWSWIVLAAICAGLLSLKAEPVEAQQVPQISEQPGFENRNPVIGGACPTCPWGAIATIVRTTMERYDWNIRQCYTCSAENSVRIVSEARRPPPDRWERPRNERLPESPDAPVDLGVTSISTLANAFHGRPPYERDGPYKNLRAIARLEHPQYLMVAVRRDLLVTDLAQIRERKLPVRILADGRELSPRVLQHYGLDEETLKSWGGELVGRESSDDFDVIIFRGYLGNSPESDVWYEATQKKNLRFLELPASLLKSLTEEFTEYLPGTVPVGYLKGVDRPIPTVVRTGQVIYGRDAMPDEFAYTLARALDENRNAFIWSHLAFSYDPATVSQTLGVPLHPAAERYYREKGYIR